ncbi:MAG: DUF393 domain-containing protein [Polyangiaceae bacterium]
MESHASRPSSPHVPSEPSASAAEAADFAVEVFFDGDCPLCTREISMLRRLDRRHRIRFTDIAAPGFDAVSAGVAGVDLMGRIHGRLPDGSLVEGVEVFRRLYDAVGFGWAVRASRLPGITNVLDRAYDVFAKNRLKWTGRCTTETCALPEGRDPSVGVEATTGSAA